MSGLTGTRALIRFILRRDRLRILVWIASIAVLLLLTAASVKELYPTQADLDEAAESTHGNAAAIAFNGPDQGLDTLGGQIAFQIGVSGLVVVALMSMFMVGRETRAEEEGGRLELVRSMAVGPHAPTAAALVVTGEMNAVVGLLMAAGLIGLGLPALGAVVFGLSYVALGAVFAGLTLVMVQITENTRVVYGVTGAMLGVAFVLRAVGDIGDGTVSWLSPIGLAQKTRPFAGERWWPLVILVVAAAGLIVWATTLATRRDLGAGLIVPRRGVAVAAAGLGRPLGLAFRLQRGSLIGWSAGVFVTGAAYGWVADDVDDLVGDNEQLREVLARAGGASLTDSYLSTSLLMLALLGTGFALQSVLRARGEETVLRAEPLLATPISRIHWVSSHVTIALLGSVAVLAAGGLGTGVAYGSASGDPDQIPRLVAAALAYAPAVWLLVGVAMVLFGMIPRATWLAWAAFVGCFVVGLLGDILDLPGWVQDVSPFQHTPQIPADDWAITPIAILLSGAVLLQLIGFGTFRRRDLTG